LKGTLKARPGGARPIKAVRSVCGDGLLDLDGDEECDASAPGGDDDCRGACGTPDSARACLCPPDTSPQPPPTHTTTTSSLPHTSWTTTSVLSTTTTSASPTTTSTMATCLSQGSSCTSGGAACCAGLSCCGNPKHCGVPGFDINCNVSTVAP